MPRAAARSRLVFCDCLDCGPDSAAPVIHTDETLAAADQVAQQLPPPKAILLFGSGLMHSLQGGSSLDECALPHMDALAKEGCLGVMASRRRQSTGGPKAAETSGGMHDLIQLCEVYEELSVQGSGEASGEQPAKLKSFGTRHQGMQVVAATNCPAARQLLGALEADLPSALQLTGCQGTTSADSGQPSTGHEPDAQGTWAGQEVGLPPPAPYADQLLQELGVGQGGSGPDLLLVHLDVQALLPAQATGQTHQDQDQVHAPAVDPDSLHEAACGGLLWLDALLSALMRRKEVRQQVLVTLVLTPQGQANTTDAEAPPPDGLDASKLGLPVQRYGPLLEAGQLLDPAVRVVTPRDMSAMAGSAAGGRHGLSVLDEVAPPHVPLVPRPMQSWQRRGLKHVDVDVHAPGICARRLPGIVRRDRAERMSLDEAAAKGGAGGILLDRLVPELAYKLGKAPKFGA